MSNYENTALWRSTLALQDDDDLADERQMLRASFVDFRKRVAFLVAEISKDLPGLTVHDVTHLDALWEMASTIAGKEYSLNPAEAFVLGGAILLHDAGMCVASYPKGLEGCKTTPQWQDAVVNLLGERGIQNPTKEDIESPPSDVADNATAQVLRALHAARANDLGRMQWKAKAKGSPEFLIQDSDLREFYGSIIGEIGASHWWSVNDLQKLQQILSAGPGVPAEWSVDPIKIACLLRVADAAHIDHRRAPRFLRSLVKPVGVSADYWAFQAKLGKPIRQGDALVIAAGDGFSQDEAEAWWLCFDTIQMIDRELHQVWERAVLYFGVS